MSARRSGGRSPFLGLVFLRFHALGFTLFRFHALGFALFGGSRFFRAYAARAWYNHAPGRELFSWLRTAEKLTQRNLPCTALIALNGLDSSYVALTLM